MAQIVKHLPVMRGTRVWSLGQEDPLEKEMPTHWRRKCQPTPVSLPEKFHRQRSLVGYSPWGSQELDTTKHAHNSAVALRKPLHQTDTGWMSFCQSRKCIIGDPARRPCPSWRWQSSGFLIVGDGSQSCRPVYSGWLKNKWPPRRQVFLLIQSVTASRVLKPPVLIQTTRDRQTMEEACCLWKSCEFEGPHRRKIFNSHGNCRLYRGIKACPLFVLHQHEDGRFPRAWTLKTKQNTTFFPKQNPNNKLHSNSSLCHFSRCPSTILFDLGNTVRNRQQVFNLRT